MGKRYRLFVAIDLPRSIKAAVTSQYRVVSGVRWVPEEQLHLTLRFIGDADAALYAAIKNSLGKIRRAPFLLMLNGADCFPSRRDPRILWRGVASQESLGALKNAVDEMLAEAGVPWEERHFSPHSTIARLRGVSRDAIENIVEELQACTSEPFMVRVFQLYSSTLTPQGAVHTVEGVYHLKEGQCNDG